MRGSLRALRYMSVDRGLVCIDRVVVAHATLTERLRAGGHPLTGPKRLLARALNQVGIEHSRPQPPPGEGRLPDFIGIGVQRSGTSWLFAQLIAQADVRGPQVSTVSGVKELHWFDRSAARRQGSYSSFFPYDSSVLCGEWTPSYVHDAEAMEAIAELPTSVQLFLALRDPVARFQSGLRHESSRHLWRSPSLVADARTRSQYGTMWRRLTGLVGEDRVTVVQLERAIQAPASVLGELLGSLGRESPPFVAEADHNASTRATRPAARLGSSMDSVVRDLRQDLELAPGLMSQLDLTLWPSVMSNQ